MSKPISTAGVWPTRLSSSSSEARTDRVFPSRRAELLGLASLGVLVVVLHASVNLPLKLPGHHGLEWMALLMFGRTLSTDRHAATTVALAAAFTASLPVWGFHGLGMGLNYLLTGLVVDALYRLLRQPGVAALGLIAALAHVAKPLWKWAAVNGLGLQFGSITAGVGFSLLSHVGFGLVGGIAGALAGSALRQRFQQR